VKTYVERVSKRAQYITDESVRVSIHFEAHLHEWNGVKNGALGIIPACIRKELERIPRDSGQSVCGVGQAAAPDRSFDGKSGG